MAPGRKRRAEPEEAGSSEDSPEPETQRRRTNVNGSDDEGYGGDMGGMTQGGESVNEMAMKLVRLALALEFQRRPLRRADITEKVLGPHGRQFKHVFDGAQHHLRGSFGMELVELPAKEKVTLQQRRAAQKSQSQAKGTASWILKSILPSEFRDPEVIQPPAAPTSTDESTYTAIYTVLVSLIRLSGGALPDAKMERSLQRLQMEDNTPVADYQKTELLMKRLERDGYVVKVKESTGTGEDDVYWTIGPRGKVEVGDDGVRGLTHAVFGEQEDEDELERKIDRSLGISDRVERREQLPEQPKKSRKKRTQQRDEDEDEDDAEEDCQDDDEGEDG